MAKKIKINGVSYDAVPYLSVPLAEGEGDAKFYDTDSGDALVNDLRAGKKAWVKGVEVVGTVPVKTEGDVTASGKTVSVPAGIFDAPVEKAVEDGSATPSSVVESNVVGDTVSAYPINITAKAAVDKAGWIESIADAKAVTKYVQVEEKTVAPSMESQAVTPTEGKLLSKVTVDPVVLVGNATAADVMKGKTFYNTSMELVTGTATVPVVNQDPEHKFLTIV